MSYWDTSALVKLYITETDSADFQTAADRVTCMVTASIARLETWTVFRRREAEGVLKAGEAAALFAAVEKDVAKGGILIQMLDQPVEEEFINVLETCFSSSPPVFIRTNDALHIASAIVAGEIDFVTADGRQRAAAELMGLTVYPTAPAGTLP